VSNNQEAKNCFFTPVVQPK